MASRSSVFRGAEVRIRFRKAFFSFFKILLPLSLSLSLVTLFYFFSETSKEELGLPINTSSISLVRCGLQGKS